MVGGDADEAARYQGHSVDHQEIGGADPPFQMPAPQGEAEPGRGAVQGIGMEKATGEQALEFAQRQGAGVDSPRMPQLMTGGLGPAGASAIMPNAGVVTAIKRKVARGAA